MEVMVIYVWQCMVVLLYDCICARYIYIYTYMQIIPVYCSNVSTTYKLPDIPLLII